MLTKFGSLVMQSVCAATLCLPISLQADSKVEIIRSATSPHIRYSSGAICYTEQLVNGHWVDRDLGVSQGGGRQHAWDRDAFDIRVKTDPKDTTAGTRLDTWRFVSASEEPAARPGERHAVVELASTTLPVGLKVHTLLDGTAVLTRWLEITNTGRGPIALTKLSVWSGRLLVR